MKISANKNVVTNFNKVSGDFAQISDSIKKADLGKNRKELNTTIAKVNHENLDSGKEPWVELTMMPYIQFRENI
jgi:hypothetical protein